MHTAFLQAPQSLPLNIDRTVRTHFLIWVPKNFAYTFGKGRFPNAGHSALAQTQQQKGLVLLVNNQPDKTQKATQTGRKQLKPLIDRVEGTDTHNLFMDPGRLAGDPAQGWEDDLGVPFEIGYFSKPSGAGSLLESNLTFNRNHTLHVVTFEGLPRISLSPELLERFSTYALIDNNCHHASLSAYLQLFRNDQGLVGPASQIIGENVFTAEVMMMIYNHSALMNSSPALAEHRRAGLSSERKNADLDRYFDASLLGDKEKKEQHVEEASERLLQTLAPELAAHLRTPSHKRSNPPAV